MIEPVKLTGFETAYKLKLPHSGPIFSPLILTLQNFLILSMMMNAQIFDEKVLMIIYDENDGFYLFARQIRSP